jgi:hypothetical protein
MAEDKPLKSSYELALERLRKSDEASGVSQKALTDAQKAAIAEVRNIYEAKLAEQKVLHDSGLRRVFDPAEREALEDRFRRDRERFLSERETKIERIRRGDSS